MALPESIIPIGRLIVLIRNVEGAYPGASPQEILSRIRNLYYGDLPFQMLIPGANFGGKAAINQADPETQRVLKLRADENGTEDNPSPYFVLENKEQLDLGHVVLGIEALLSTFTFEPYLTYGIPRLDPASWVADVALAVAWADEPSCRPAEIQAAADRYVADGKSDPYYLASAPREDLLGDVDFFGLHSEWDGTKKLSEIFSSYYGGMGWRNRWDRFQTHSANAWAFGSRSDVERRVDRMAQLAADGKVWAAINTAVTWATGPFGEPLVEGLLMMNLPAFRGPPARTFPSTPRYVRRFFAWVAQQNGLAPV